MVILKEHQPVLMVDQDNGVGGLLIWKVEDGSVGLLEGLDVVKD